ncbi:MAG: PKD domain-containing protein [Flavobacteriales bacterium]|nr:PKD domain-containing protein [Flavobacteriales bacterium]
MLLKKHSAIVILVLVVTCLALFTNGSMASHSVGADLTYTCLGGNQYLVSLAFYRDCSGVNAPSAANVIISSSSCGQNLTVNLQKVPGTGQEVTPICSSMQTTCGTGSLPGIQEWVYEGVVTLPAQCVDWTFSYSICCRNASITNISSPGGQSMYIEATLNNTLGCNSSPVFSNKPVPFVCDNQLFCFSPGALDPEFDSLVYTLVTPMTSVSGTVNYTGSFSASQPLSSSPSVSFNSSTGDLCMTPSSSSEVTVTAIRVEQWSNGVLIGSVMRDIQINVVSCTNIVPEITGFDGNPPSGSNTQITVCSGAPITETISSSDVDGGQVVSMTWNNGIQGATFTITGSPYPTGVFSWTPAVTDISNVPYCFTVTVQDDNCPYNASFTQTYCIIVRGLNTIAGPAQTISCDSTAVVTSSATGGIAPYSFLWSNGATTTSTNVGCGEHQVIAVDAVGCIGMDTVNLFCFNAPVAAFSSSAVCLDNPTSFMDSTLAPSPTSITGWNWDFGDGTGSSNLQDPSYTFTTSGVFGVQLVATNDMGCSDTIVDSVSVTPSPVGAFSAASVCFGDTTVFSDSSTMSSGTIASWSWFFGDTSSSSLQNPAHVYLTAGTFNTTLVVTSDNGCANIVIQPVTVNALPVAEFTWTNACIGNVSSFADVTIVPSDTVVAWSWDFGDTIGTSTLPNPSYLYADTGSYSVTLIVTSANGCIDTVVHVAEVFPLPIAGFSTDTVCAEALTQFIDTSSIGTISAWQWNFGDGDTSIIQNPPHAYDTGGTYTATLIVVTTDGCQGTIQQPVIVNFLPTALFSATRVCFNDVTVFTNGSQAVLPDTIAISVWDFGDGSAVDMNSDPTYVFPTSGIFNTMLAITSSTGCVDTLFQQVIVDTFPTPDFTAAPVCLSVQSSFMDLSTAPTGDTLSFWAWDFGDGTGTAITQNPTYLYNAADTFTVTLTITSDKECVSTVSLPVVVYPLPIADFSFVAACPRFETSFTNLSSAGVSSWSWDLGDGAASSLSDPIHTYDSSGAYIVQLNVVDTNQCPASFAQQVDAYPEPIAGFMASPDSVTLIAPFVTFTNTSSGADSFYWDIGDGFTFITTSDSVYQHTYSDQDTATYLIELVVANTFGCLDSIAHEVIVFGDHALFVPNAFSPNNDFINDTFFPKVIGIDEDNFEMLIFDRWGDLIYKTDNINAPWDGTANEGKKLAQQDVYIWLIRASDITAGKHQYIGHVTLIR